MSLTIKSNEKLGALHLHLKGELDTGTAPQLTPAINSLRENPPEVLVLNLSELEYISSAGLRCVFQMKKLMQQTAGRFMVAEPTPQVKKVFDIVKAIDVKSVFSSAAELDAYLDKAQRKVTTREWD